MAFFDYAEGIPPFDVFEYVTNRSRALHARPTDVRGPGRWQSIVRVREIIARELRAHDLSLPEIGKALGGRHHTTVMNLLGYFDHEKKRRQRG